MNMVFECAKRNETTHSTNEATQQDDSTSKDLTNSPELDVRTGSEKLWAYKIRELIP